MSEELPQGMKEPPRSREEEERDRRAANIFLLCAAVVLVGVGIWIAKGMVDARNADNCMSSGRRNCTPIDAPAR